MKKLLVVLFCLTLVLALVACGQDTTPPANDTEATADGGAETGATTESEAPATSESADEAVTDSEAAEPEATESEDTSASSEAGDAPEASEPSASPESGDSEGSEEGTQTELGGDSNIPGAGLTATTPGGDSETTEPEEELPELNETPEIRTWADLLSMKEDGSYTLMNDIDLSRADGSYREWTPFGSQSKPFTGTFDGNGYKITGFQITAESAHVGFFGYNNGVIRNLELADFKIDLNQKINVSAGAIAGYNGGTIYNSYVSGGIMQVKVIMPATASIIAATPQVYVGGAVGNNVGEMANVYATTDLTVYAETGEVATTVTSKASVHVGGLVGDNMGYSATAKGKIFSCFATGNIKADAVSDSFDMGVGGLVGSNIREISGSNYSGMVNKSFRLAEQSMSITTKTVEEGAEPVVLSPSGTTGTETSIENLQNEAWICENMWQIESDGWSFAVGAFPVFNQGAPAVTEITETEQLSALQGQVVTRRYKLAADLDLGGIAWNPISYFFGEIDGNGYTISNFKLNPSAENVGLIAIYNGTIKNLKVTGYVISGTPTDISTSMYIGVIAGKIESGIIENCHVFNTLAVAGDEPQEASGQIALSESPSKVPLYVGTIAGYNEGGSVVNCTVGGEITVTGAKTAAYVGGLLGKNDATVQLCVSECVMSSVTADDYAYTAGLVAENKGTIDRSAATGSVSAIIETTGQYGFAHAGGLVALNSKEVTLSYATGDVVCIAKTTTAQADNAMHANVGGLVGRNAGGTITKCYASGNVTGETNGNWDWSNAGALVGRDVSGKVLNCFATGNVSSTAEGSYVYAAGLVANAVDTNIDKSYRVEEQTFEVVNTLIPDAEDPTVPAKSDVPTNTSGDQRALSDFQKRLFLSAAMGWSNTTWNFGTDEAPALPTLIGLGASFDAVQS